jgi:glycosyltransferase involved in cell wall biosynthesis
MGAQASTYGFSRELQRWLQQNVARFGGVVINSIWTFPSLAARGRVPYVVFTHGMLDPWFKRTYPLKHFRSASIGRSNTGACARPRQSCSPARSSAILRRKASGPTVGTALLFRMERANRRQPRQANRRALYRKLPRLRSRRYILFLSRIHEKKGCDLLVEAFARVAPAHPDVDLVIAGPDQIGLQAKLQLQAQNLGTADRIHWPGLMIGDPKWGALRGCDAFILPSHQENFGVAVAEALACGRPVLISNQVNIWQEIEQEKVGLVAPDALAGTEELLSRWLLLDEAGRNATMTRTIDVFRKRYSMRCGAVAIKELFESFSRKRPSPKL